MLGLARFVRKYQLEVLINSNTPELGAAQYTSMIAERMTVVSGEIWAKLPGRADFQLYPAGTSFEIPSKNAFDVRTREPAAYLCEFL